MPSAAEQDGPRLEHSKSYTAKAGSITSRVVRSLHMEYRGLIWTLTARCELRAVHRVIRIDLIQSAEALPELFVDEPGKRLSDY